MRQRTLVRLGAVAVAIATAAVGTPVGAGPGAPNAEGPDVPRLTDPVAVVTAFADERFTCEEGVRTATVTVPGGWDRVVLEFSSTPDGDPWDRVFGVAIGGVEVLRGTTPRTAFTVERDVTAYANLLPAGATVDVSLFMGSYVGSLLGTVRLLFHADEPTATLVPAAHRAVGAFTWRSLQGGAAVAAAVGFPDVAPSGATVELVLSGHGGEEFWYVGNPRPRRFDVLVDSTVVAQVVAMPYVYALAGFGNEDANTPCVGPGTSTTGDIVHPLLWWSAHRAADAAGAHTGNGEIPSYRAAVDADLLPLLTGTRTLEVRQVGGSARWITSAAVLLDGAAGA